MPEKLIYGVDSSYEPVTNGLIGEVKGLLKGEMPRFWGRYFIGKDAEYDQGKESPVLAKANIPVLPIARRTNQVGGTEEKGRKNASDCIKDIVKSFKESDLKGRELFIFLDVEASPILSEEYYIGWANEIVHQTHYPLLKFRPCVYSNRENDSWRVLKKVVEEKKAPCYGAWIAAHHKLDPKDPPCKKLPTSWEEKYITNSKAGGKLDLPFPILAWQCCMGCLRDKKHKQGKVDVSLINPDHEDYLLSRLILPSDPQC